MQFINVSGYDIQLPDDEVFIHFRGISVPLSLRMSIRNPHKYALASDWLSFKSRTLQTRCSMIHHRSPRSSSHFHRHSKALQELCDCLSTAHGSVVLRSSRMCISTMFQAATEWQLTSSKTTSPCSHFTNTCDASAIERARSRYLPSMTLPSPYSGGGWYEPSSPR